MPSADFCPAVRPPFDSLNFASPGQNDTGQGVPYMATYGASKGFGLLFAEALAREVEGHGATRTC